MRPPAEAVEWSRRATSLDPREPQFRDTLGWALRNNGDQRAALGELVAARDLDGNDSGIWYHLGVVYAELKQDREAIDALTRALRLDPDFFAAADAQQRLQALR
jgi:Flp pilus assembly protein TadD